MGRFNPANVSALRRDRPADFIADRGAGLTIVVVLLDGSRFQVAGPTGALVPFQFSIATMRRYVRAA
jgi:hypothetical protein